MVSSYARATAYEGGTSTAMRQERLHRRFPELTVPVTLAFGERDRLIRPTHLSTPGARTVLLPDCGHIPMWDDPQTITELLTRAARPQPTMSPS